MDNFEQDYKAFVERAITNYFLNSDVAPVSRHTSVRIWHEINLGYLEAIQITEVSEINGVFEVTFTGVNAQAGDVTLNYASETINLNGIILAHLYPSKW